MSYCYNEKRDIGIFDIPDNIEDEFYPLVATWQDEDGKYKQQNQLHNAVWLLLFTDIKSDERMEFVEEKNGGWAGNTDNIEMGSLLYTLFKAPLIKRTVELAKIYTLQALDTLIKQGTVARIDVFVEKIGINGLFININMFGKNGYVVYSSKFRKIWK